MCGEEDPSRCHRRKLIARTLIQRSITVEHIRGDGKLHNEEDLLLAEKPVVDSVQLNLFSS
jgi:uncharacterized protein (DUF488 family)